MNSTEVLKLVDMLHKNKEIDKEVIFEAIEVALLTSAKKKHGADRNLAVKIDRVSGAISATDEYGGPLDLSAFGRIAAQTAKQVIIQRLRDEEHNVIYTEYERRVNDIVNGSIHRYEGSNLVINLGRTEGYLPKKEQVREERYQIGDRIRAYVKEVKRDGPRVKIILSRTHKDFIRKLFEQEVPEIGQGIIKIEAIVREPGYRTKIAVSSTNDRVDCVGACVGVRGTRIKNIIDELAGEKIDIIRWDESPAQLIKNALKPAEVFEVTLDEEQKRAKALVANSQQSLAIGKRGLNVRLASRLAGWEIDIYNERQMLEEKEKCVLQLSSLPHITPEMADLLYSRGYESLEDLLDLGAEQLAKLEGLDTQRATEVIEIIDRLLTEVREEAELDTSAAAKAGVTAATADGGTSDGASSSEGEPESDAPEDGAADATPASGAGAASP